MVRTLTALAALLPFTSAQLHLEAVKAGLKYFGAATDTPGFRERAGLQAAYPQYDAILRDGNEFGQTTPTNGQKWLFTEPERGVFNFTEGDIVTSIAQEQKILQRCHALVWHSQLAPWVEETEWTPEELKSIIVEHVTKVMEHYKGKCYAWDVVNEALEDDGTYRKSLFYNILGEEYIKLAFQTAAAVEPGVKLYYNDYSLERPSPKSEAAIRIVKMLQDAGIKIDGVGLQAHHTAHRAPSYDEQKAVLASYAALGVETAYTELDVRIALPLNETGLALQAGAYKNATKACLDDKSCVGITIWDFYDPFSWVPPVFPGNGAALLWFDNFEKHPAYYSILEAFREKTGEKPPCKPAKRSFVERRSSKLY